jgi:hypothetical protein
MAPHQSDAGKPRAAGRNRYRQCREPRPPALYTRRWHAAETRTRAHKSEKCVRSRLTRLFDGRPEAQWRSGILEARVLAPYRAHRLAPFAHNWGRWGRRRWRRRGLRNGRWRWRRGLWLSTPRAEPRGNHDCNQRHITQQPPPGQLFGYVGHASSSQVETNDV